MSDYGKLVEALRETATFTKFDDLLSKREQKLESLAFDAAAAIEDLQAELEKKRTADCWGCKCEKLEPNRGEWELIDGAEPMRWGCSRCKYMSWETSNYCPRCGAKMNGEQNVE